METKMDCECASNTKLGASIEKKFQKRSSKKPCRFLIFSNLAQCKDFDCYGTGILKSWKQTKMTEHTSFFGWIIFDFYLLYIIF